uniref:Eukaryotic translation initiation factor 4E n=1 Tax=Panagrolaimus sp. PS1159 TaxID=55785 RepID=A0AC35GE40_9BILA
MKKKIAATINKISDVPLSEGYEEKEKSQTWKKSSATDLCSNSLSLNDENEKCWKKNSSPNATNNSTLSLRISAYENSNEASSDSLNKSFQKFLLIQKQKQIHPASTFVSQSPFEFQRQRKDKVPEPEVSQFKASHRLLNLNKSYVHSNTAMKEKHGWNLWTLDSHHGELWENRFQITCKNPTVSKIAETPSGWGVFRDGYKPMWEDEKNSGRLTAKSFQAVKLYEIVAAFFDLLADDSNVSGIIYTRSKNFGLWINTSDDKIIGELKSKFSTICNREEDEIKWDDFKRDKKPDLHLRGVIWKYGQLSFETETLTNL